MGKTILALGGVALLLASSVLHAPPEIARLMCFLAFMAFVAAL